MKNKNSNSTNKFNILSNILLILSVLGSIFAILSAVLFYIPDLYFVVGFLLIVIVVLFTIGTIFIMCPNLWNNFMSGGDTVKNIALQLIQIMPAVAVGCIITSIASVLLAVIGKSNKLTSKIIFAIIIIAICIFLLISK